MLLSFNKCSISALTAPNYQSIEYISIGENSNFSSQLQVDLHCASPIPYPVFISCDINEKEYGPYLGFDYS